MSITVKNFKYLIKRVNMDDSYDYYLEVGHDRIVMLSTYLEIIYGFIKFIMRKVLEGYDVKLSGGDSLGKLGIRGKKVHPRFDENGEIIGIAPSWGKTFKMWNENPETKVKGNMIYCFNEHSNGIKYRLGWHKKGMNLKNGELFKLTFSRPNTRAVWRKVIEENKEYYVIE